jgi:Proteasome subunit
VTVAAGFVCSDGVVLSADTEISFGIAGKKQESKIFPIDRGHGCYLTYTGHSDFVKELVDRLRQETKLSDTAGILECVKRNYQEMRAVQQQKTSAEERSWAHILITVREHVNEPWLDYDTRLYLARDDCFFRVEKYAVLGIGEEHAAAIIDPLCFAPSSVRAAAYAAIYALRKVKQSVQGVGGSTELIEITNSNSLPFADFGHEEIRQIESDYEFLEEKLHPLLIAFPSEMIEENFQLTLERFVRELTERRKQRKPLNL